MAKYKRHCLTIANACFAICVLAVWLSGCMPMMIGMSSLTQMVPGNSYYDYTCPDADTQEYQDRIHPVRTIKVAVFYDPDYEGDTTKPKIQAMLDEASYHSEYNLAGIAIEPVFWKEVKFKEGSSKKVLRELSDKLKPVLDEADETGAQIVLGVGTGGLSIESLTMLFGATWLAMTDRYYRQFIRMKRVDTGLFLHEFYHCFAWDQTHYGSSLLGGMRIVPGVRYETDCLTPELLDEVLKNKWREFGKKV